MYPRANTPGCTKQACGFRDLTKEFEAAGFDIYGLSYDKPKYVVVLTAYLAPDLFTGESHSRNVSEHRL